MVLTFNQEKTIARTLDSILSQKCTCSFEIIVGDDASTDSTRTICEQYEAKYPDVIKINPLHENYGVVRNYEETLSRCSGTYRMACAGDDWWSNPNKMQLQFDYMEKHRECVVLYGGFTEYYEATGNSREKKPIRINGDLFEVLLQMNPVCAPTACIRMSALRKYDFHDFVKEGFLVEDWPNWLALSKYGTFDTMDESLVTYTIAYGTLHNNRKFEARKRYLDNFHKMRKYFISSRGKGDQYDTLIGDVYHKSVGDAAVKYGERKVALENYKQIQSKDKKTWIKIICCMVPILFNRIHSKMNRNM